MTYPRIFALYISVQFAESVLQVFPPTIYSCPPSQSHHQDIGQGSCHRTVQIILIKCINPPFKFNHQLLHSTSTPRLPAVTRIDYTGTLAKRRAQVITSKSRVQINLQQRLTQASETIYNKVLHSRVTFQIPEFKHSGSKMEFKTETHNTIR